MENENFVVKVQPTEFTFDDFKMAHSGAHMAHQRWTEAQKKFEETVKQLKDDKEFKKTVSKMMKADMKMLQKATKLAEEFEELTGDGMLTDIKQTFKAVFKNIRSRTMGLGVKTKDGEVAVGPYGFGLKWNVQSKPVYWDDDFLKIFTHSDEIIKALRDHSPQMSRWGDKLEKFMKLLPDVQNMSKRGVVMTLKQPVLLSEIDSYNDSQPMIATTIKIDDEINLYAGDDRFGVDIDPDYLDGDEFIAYYQLHDQIPAIVDEMEEKLNPDLEKARESVAELKKAFGRELLLNEV